MRVQERQHGISSYNKGCRCDQCVEAGSRASRGARMKVRRRDAPSWPVAHYCMYCPDVFPTLGGLHVHESVLHP